MREIKYTSRFKRDYKREKSAQHGKKLDAILMEAVNMLAADRLLPRRYIAVGKTRARRFSVVVFTLRVADDRLKLRPISACFMHKKEIAKYEKEIAGLQN